MSQIGLIIEGVYDEKALKCLVKRARPDAEIIARPCSGKTNLIRKFSGYLEEFRYSSVNKALVIRDSDGKCFANLKAKFRSKIQNRTYPFPLDFLFIRQELEAWFLADENALANLTARRVSPHHEPENCLHAKEKLERILSLGRLTYTDAIAERLAQSVDLDILKERCPSFRRFWDLLASAP